MTSEHYKDSAARVQKTRLAQLSRASSSTLKRDFSNGGSDWRIVSMMRDSEAEKMAGTHFRENAESGVFFCPFAQNRESIIERDHGHAPMLASAANVPGLHCKAIVGCESNGGSQMGDLSLDEAKEIIGSLVDSLELALVQVSAQKVVLTVQGEPDWESQVLLAQAMFSPHFGEVFLPLRELLLGTSAVRSSETNWHQIVRRLIESANKTDLE